MIRDGNKSTNIQAFTPSHAWETVPWRPIRAKLKTGKPEPAPTAGGPIFTFARAATRMVSLVSARHDQARAYRLAPGGKTFKEYAGETYPGWCVGNNKDEEKSR
jgi:hypothetical protein